MHDILATVRAAVESASDRLALIEAIRDVLYELSPQRAQPVDRVRWVPVEDVQPNDYNPNAVATKEMKLLYHSISQDGFTQPIVTIQDPDTGKYVIVDGFHRYHVGKGMEDIRRRNNGLLPVVVIEKTMNERMAATIRHNRARGEHGIDGMGKLVFRMLSNGWDDADICNELGLEAEELLKLKHITGFSALFKDTEYGKAWETPGMIRLRRKYEQGENGKARLPAPPAKRPVPAVAPSLGG